MKFVDEYRDPQLVKNLVAEIKKIQTKPWVIMEVCGGQTHSIVKHGLDELLPEGIELVHGPGCPVCVTPLEMIDRAHAIAKRPDVIFCSFGDMLRVPGSDGDLFSIRSNGGDVRIVYSPLDCIKIAQANPEKKIVFFAVGFETTAPANAMLVYQAKKLGLKNVSILVSHVLVPPAIEAILSSPQNRVQAFLGPGHVCTIMGFDEYEPLIEKYKIPIVITGFEPLDLLEGIYRVVQMLEAGEAHVENQYSRALTREGNKQAQQVLKEVFTVSNRKWRGVGEIPNSGWTLREEYAEFNAEKVFDVATVTAEEPAQCISGLILQGVAKPHHCPAFGKECTPMHPMGATMVSAEGACAAYFAYGRHVQREAAGAAK